MLPRFTVRKMGEPMKYAGWIAAFAIFVSLLGAFEIIYQLKGSEAVVEIASVCILLVWVFLAMYIAKWADREIKNVKVEKLRNNDL